ncbi:MAG: hypothetical protein LBN74_09680 [Prevotella sp.]|jgi:hypothetical protein|nr:hypothetical protein [Prevotella sp.]
MKKGTITLALTLLFAFASVVISAQGIYEENDLTVLSDESEEGGYDDYDAPLRAIEKPTGNPGPVGEGLLILSALAGGYALVKKRSSKKESNL